MRATRRVVLAAALAGAAVALVVTLLLPSTYRASGVLVLTREGRAPGDDRTLAPAAQTAAELLESRAVTESVVANLRLDDSAEGLLDRVDVDVGAQSSLLGLSVEAEDPDEARQAAQELAEVFTVLYNTRFGPETTASIWEAPRADDDRVSPDPARNLALGALVGALAGLALVSRRRRAPRVATEQAPVDDGRLAQRIAAVTERELALARRGAELALRERAAPAPAPPTPPPEVEPAPEPIPEQLEPAAVAAGEGDWTVGAVAELLERYGPEFPERRDELEVYLQSFRDVAGPGGELPTAVRYIVDDEFAELIARARADTELSAAATTVAEPNPPGAPEPPPR